MAGTPRVVATPGMEPSMTTDDDSDWLHRDNSYQQLTTQNLIAPAPSRDKQSKFILG